MFRLRIADYFDSVVNKVDLFTEKKIQKEEAPNEDWWNTRRQEQIDTIREIERVCLIHLKSVDLNEIERDEWMPRVFVEYCFTTEYDGLLFVVKADRYVEPRERQLLEIQLAHEYLIAKIANQPMGLLRINKFVCNCRDHFLPQLTTVDISMWLKQYNNIESASLIQRNCSEYKLIPFQLEDGLQIESGCLMSIITNSQDEKKHVELAKLLISLHDQIDNISIILNYIDFKPDLMIDYIQTIQLDNRIRFDFASQVQYLDQFVEIDSLIEAARKFTCENSVIWNVIQDWKKIKNISISIRDRDQLACFDWSCLDSYRPSLEYLRISFEDKSRPMPVSSALCHGMKNLNHLSLVNSFPVDSSPEFFADLTKLNWLSIHVNETLLGYKWLIDLPILDFLKLSFNLSKDQDIQATVRPVLSFKVPKLRELYIFGDICSRYDLASLMSCFSHSKKLEISSDFDTLRSGWFKCFHQVSQLELCQSGAVCINSQLFEGLEQTAHLVLWLMSKNILDRCAFRNLVNLETVIFYERGEFTAEDQDKSFWDGLNSLRTIEYSICREQSTEKFVYFENLNRHVKVIHS